MVKYELKKLFLNRFILITLTSCIALTFARSEERRVGKECM